MAWFGLAYRPLVPLALLQRRAREHPLASLTSLSGAQWVSASLSQSPQCLISQKISAKKWESAQIQSNIIDIRFYSMVDSNGLICWFNNKKNLNSFKLIPRKKLYLSYESENHKPIRVKRNTISKYFIRLKLEPIVLYISESSNKRCDSLKAISMLSKEKIF